MQPPVGFWAFNSFAIAYGDGEAVTVNRVAAKSAKTAEGKDVLADLATVDDRYYPMPENTDRAELVFNAPPAKTVMDRTVFLALRRGWYRKLHLRDQSEPDLVTFNRVLTVPGAAVQFCSESNSPSGSSRGWRRRSRKPRGRCGGQLPAASLRLFDTVTRQSLKIIRYEDAHPRSRSRAHCLWSANQFRIRSGSRFFKIQNVRYPRRPVEQQESRAERGTDSKADRFRIRKALEAKGLNFVETGRSDLNVRYTLGAARKVEAETYPAGWRGWGTRIVEFVYRGYARAGSSRPHYAVSGLARHCAGKTRATLRK